MENQLLHNINEVSAALVKTPGRTGDLTSILQHIAHTAQVAFSADSCVIIAINPITGRFIDSQIVAGDLQVRSERLHDEPGVDGVTQRILKNGVVLIQDLDEQPQYHSRFTRNEGISALAGLAMRTRHRQRPLGTICLNFRQVKIFNSADYECFHNFARQAALILQEAWLARHYETIARIGQEVNHDLRRVEDLFLILQNYVDTVFDESHTLMLAIYQPQTNTLDLHLRERGQTFFRNGPLQGACYYTMETQQPCFIRHLSKEKETGQWPFQIISIEGTRLEESLIFAPVMLRGISLGVLSIQHPEPNAYGQEDQFILQLLASYIALALHNMRLYSSLSQLNETGQILTQQLESEQTLQATVDKIQAATRADVVILYPCEAPYQRFTLSPRIAGTLLNSHLEAGAPEDIAALMLAHKKPIFARKSATLYTELHSNRHVGRSNFQEREQVHSTAALPLLVEDELVGILFLNFRQTQHFDSTQKLSIEGLAHYAAIAIKNSQAFGKLTQRRLRELEILQWIDRALSSNLDLKIVLCTLLRMAHEQVPAEEVSILLYNPKTQALETAEAIGRHAEASLQQTIFLQENRGITRWVVEHKKPARVANIRRDPLWRDLHVPVADDIISELDVPLFNHEEVVGVLNFESIREGAFRQEDEDFLLTLAGQAVLAIKNAQTYEREKRLVAEGRVLNEIGKQLIVQLDSAHIFGLILEKALELTHSTRGNLMLTDLGSNDLWMAAERGVTEEYKGRRQSLEQGVVGNVARNKQLLNVDLSQPPWNEVYVPFISGMRSELAVPMLAGNELRGVLNIESPVPHNFDEHDEHLLQGLADLAVVALQNVQAFEREKRLVAEGQVLNEISKEITSQLDPVRVFDLILEKAQALTHSTVGSLHLYDPYLKDLTMVVERGIARDKKGQRQRLNEGLVGHVAARKELLNVGDVTQSPWNKIYLEFFPGTFSELAVPMLAGNELRGVLNIESSVRNNFDDGAERLIKGLAGLAVVALQNAERYEKARREAQRFQLLYEAGQELGKVTDLSQLEQAYDAVLRIAEEESQSQVLIRRYHEETQELEVVRISYPHDAASFHRKAVNSGINGQVAREQRTIMISDITNPPPDAAVPQPSDPETRSLLIAPIVFKEEYYGNLVLNHKEVDHFQGADILFFEGLAQQLASTIYRLETTKARQESEQRAASAEEMSSIGQSAFEVTHRLDNDLGLVDLYVTDIQSELEKQGVMNTRISKKLLNIRKSVQTALSFSFDIKQNLAKWKAKEETAGGPVVLSPRVLLEEAATVSPLSPSIYIELQVDEDVAAVLVIHGLAADILHNLVVNAMQAMPDGGVITLHAHNAGRSVALSVTDTGIGIPPEKLSKVFDLFFSTKRSSGFGLWSSRRNALKNQGDLKVESELGKGTTFTLFLPRNDVKTS
jgi:GAF domain-containing protein